MTGLVFLSLSHGTTTEDYAAAHQALKANDAVWQSLAFAGIQHDGQGGLAEYRHCPLCQSTLARAIDPEEALSLCQLQQALQERSMQAVSDAVQALRRLSGSDPSPRPSRNAVAQLVAACLVLSLGLINADDMGGLRARTGRDPEIVRFRDNR